MKAISRWLGAIIVAFSIGTVISGRSAPKFLDAQGRDIKLGQLSYSHF